MHIAEYVDDKRALAALMRVNHKTHQVCEPKVYRHAVKKWLRYITFLAAAAGNLATLKLAKRYGATFDGIFPLTSPSK
ncbi:hypothetical protein CGCTS75_v004623 [Colletotrichum tropicale]|nr:hypothetical protein CGCTS75_v004623 [Colletotrichum tropicale]